MSFVQIGAQFWEKDLTFFKLNRCAHRFLVCCSHELSSFPLDILKPDLNVAWQNGVHNLLFGIHDLAQWAHGVAARTNRFY